MMIAGVAIPAESGLARTRLRCVWCEAARPPDLRPFCDTCGGTLEAETDTPALHIPAVLTSLSDLSPSLPVAGPLASCGEGATPLLRLGRLFPADEVYAKAEWINPTGSFKDRGAAVAVSAAAALGAKGIVCASTGNNAAAVSSYSARAGLPCIVVVSRGTPAGKIVHVRAHGATVLEVEGTFSDAYALARRINEVDPAWANLTSTYLSPFMTAAYATITYELWRQLDEGLGSVLVPIGAGPMLAGILQGARKLREAGKIDRLPVLIGAQAAGCAPIAHAFEQRRDEVAAWDGPATTIAGSINDPLRGYPGDGTRTLRAIRATGGAALAVGDDAIRTAMADLGRHEGIACEPAAATPLAALRALIGRHDLPRPIVLVVSAHVLKDPPKGVRDQVGLAMPAVPEDRDIRRLLAVQPRRI